MSGYGVFCRYQWRHTILQCPGAYAQAVLLIYLRDGLFQTPSSSSSRSVDSRYQDCDRLCAPRLTERFTQSTYPRLQSSPTMADLEKDFARFSSHNGNYQYNYLPRLNFASEGTRNMTAPPTSTYLPRQSMAADGTHHHSGPLDSNYPSRRAASTEQTRHHNHLHNPSFLSRHDPGTENTRPQDSTVHHRHSFVSPNKVSSEDTHDHSCPTCEAHAAYDNPPIRSSSPDSFQQTGNTFLNEDMSEEAALQKIKTGQSVTMTPEASYPCTIESSKIMVIRCSRSST